MLCDRVNQYSVVQCPSCPLSGNQDHLVLFPEIKTNPFCLGYVPINLLGAYSVSKTALLGLTKVVSSAVCDNNIRVNGVAPGIIQTKFSAALWQNEHVAEQTMEQIPLGKFGEAKDIAGVTSFLCSEDAAYITGETIVAAGGMTSHL